MDRGAWKAAVHGIAEGRTRLSDFTFTFHFHALEKEMATHSSVLAWRIPGTGEPGGLSSMGSHRVGHDWSDLAAVAAGCICQFQSLNHPSPPSPLVTVSLSSAAMTISVLKIGSFVPFFFKIPHMRYHMILVFLFLTYFAQYDNL